MTYKLFSRLFLSVTIAYQVVAQKINAAVKPPPTFLSIICNKLAKANAADVKNTVKFNGAGYLKQAVYALYSKFRISPESDLIFNFAHTA